DPVFENAWGVSDEDLFRRALTELDRLQQAGRPFFALLLTVSNHRPYTYPAGRIPEKGQSRENAVKYADWALGYFFREAKRHSFYARTLFVVMGDHGARVTGSQLFPMKSYRVPVLFLGPDPSWRDRRWSTLGCSLDIAPTILGQLGGRYRSVFFGRDLLHTPPEAGRALMQHNHDVALLDARNRLTVLGFGRKATEFLMDPKTYKLTRLPQPEPKQAGRVAALFQAAYELYYSDRWFPEASAGSRLRVAGPPKSSRTR
ncbi:MAG: LTA synthase family protein, partial [Planctomycetes bacterium]|nr:LTA synthase family protein [Planctomycetota bacterium]